MTNELIEENNYYPFGLKHRGYNEGMSSTGNSLAQRYKFGGKELTEVLDLDTYDFGARNYDATLGRWINIDPLAEEYYDFSSFNYVGNDPVSFIDPNGMWRIRGGRITGRRSRSKEKITFNYSFHSLVNNEVIGGDKFGMIPYIGLIQSANNLGEGFRANSWSVGFDGLTDFAFAVVGGKIAKKFAGWLMGDSGKMLAAEFTSMMTSVLGDALIADTAQALFIDKFVTDKLLEEGAIVGMENAEITGNYSYSKGYIDDLKASIAEENGLDSKNEKHENKLERLVHKKLKARAKEYEKAASEQYQKMLKAAREAARKRR